MPSLHCFFGAKNMPNRGAKPPLFRLSARLRHLMRALLLFAPPHSTDIYRYIWDGRVQADGINPYRYVPADPALAHLRDAAIY